MSKLSKNFPTLPTKEIKKILHKKENEDIDTISSIESFFIKKRGYVFKIPKPNSPVILLLSGGLDSITIWAILMDVYKLNVYPLYIKRRKSIGQNQEQQSIKHYSKIYKKKYKKFFNTPFTLKSFQFNYQVANKIIKDKISSEEFIIHNLSSAGNFSIEPNGITTILAYKALDYRNILWANSNKKISTILCSIVKNDGELVKSQTLTSIRSTMLSICTTTNNYSLQFTSLPVEKEMNFFFDKVELINWANTKNIDLRHTHSCNHLKIRRVHCGTCLNCKNRKYTFTKSNQKDNTLYLSHLTVKLKNYIVKQIGNIINYE